MLTRNLVKVLIIVFGLLAIATLSHRARSATTLLPNGEQCFQTGAGPVVAGSVNMYSPGTTIPKTTWTNSSQSAVNTNPIQLDANGCAIIYGVGSYRQQLWSGPVVGGIATGNLIYDLTTADTSSFNSTFWAGTAGGTPNAITVTDAGFNNTDGSVINFVALNSNTGGATLSVSGGGAITIEQSTSTGPAALTSGCIVANNPVSVVYSSSAAAFLLLTQCATPSGGAAATATPQPQGYLTLSSDSSNPIMTGDFVGATTIYYTAYVGNQIPIWNGSAYVLFTFSQLSDALSAGSLNASTIYDVFVFSNSGVPTLVTGPAWANSGAGSGSRGTGASTTQLQRVSGFWVNAVQITALNGVTTFTVPANQATYVGSILIDSSAGTVTDHVTIGQNRKWSTFNAYNRSNIVMHAGDPTPSWTYSSTTTRASNNTSGNGGTILTGLSEVYVEARFNQIVNISGTVPNSSLMGIGFNTTTAFSGQNGTIGTNTTSTLALTSTLSAVLLEIPVIGRNSWQMLEQGAGVGTTTWLGDPSGNMEMTLRFAQ